MTTNSLIYNKNTTGEQFDQPDSWSVRILRAEGTDATDKEIDEVYQQYSHDGQKKRLEDEMTDFWPRECSQDGFQIVVERADGLPLTPREVDIIMLCYYMGLREESAQNQQEVIVTPQSTYHALSQLPQAALLSWAEAMRQLAPDDDVQLVTLTDEAGVRHLLESALIERYDDLPPHQYIVLRRTAYCAVGCFN
jgi:hypothetical protein